MVFSKSIWLFLGMSKNAKYVKALGKQIDKIRREKGLSFQEMALRCDMDKSQAFRICTQGSNITVVTLHKIAKGLGVTIPELFDLSIDMADQQ